MAADPKFIAAQTAYNQALALKIQIDRGEFGALKKNITAFFDTSPILEQYAPDEPWLGTGSSEIYDAALAKAAAAITVINDGQVGPLSAQVTTLLEQAKALAQATKSKRASKHEAVEYLKTQGGPTFAERFRALVGRSDHIPSATLIERLTALAPTPTAETQTHINNLQPFTQKATLKQNITALFESPEYKACFGISGVHGLRRYLRTDHAPLLDLRDALQKSATGLAEIDTDPKRKAQLAKIAEYREQLVTRLQFKERLRDYEQKAKSLTRDFTGNAAKISEFANQLDKRIAILDARIKAEKTKLDAIQGEIDTHQTSLDTLLERHDESLKKYELELKKGPEGGDTDVVQPPAPVAEINRLRQVIADKHIERDAIVEAIEQAELGIAEMMQILGFCDEKKAEINDYKTRLDASHQKYKEAKVLVLYFSLSDDVGATLAKLADQLRGGNSSLDVVGSINVVLLFEAGVRAGYDLGIAALYAKVGMTLALSGTLAILESREVMFSHRLALYLCMEAKAQVGTPADVSEQLEALSIPSPPELLNASVQASCNLINRQACHVYASEKHWAAQWSHEITRRIVFLNRYTPGVVITPDWLDGQMKDIAAAVGADAVSGDDVQARIKQAIDRDNKTITLLRQPYKQLHFEPVDRTKWSGGLEVVGYELASKATSQQANFRFKRSTSAGTGSREMLGSLDEFISLYEAGAIQGHAVYHKFTPQSLGNTGERHYLEVMQRETSSITVGSSEVAWVTVMRDPPRDPQALYRLSSAVNFTPMATYPEGSKKVTLPEQAYVDVPVAVADQLNFATEVALRLELIESGGEDSAVLQRLLALPDQIGEVGERLGQVNQVAGSDMIQAIADHSSDFSEAAKPVTESVKLGTSSSSYVRYIDQPRFSLDATGTLSRSTEKAWTPQVFRGYSLHMAKIDLPIPDVPIIPGLSAYFGLKLECKREVSQYELLGTNTFSYLKMIHKRMTDSAALLGWSDTGLMEPYLTLHWPEIADLLKNVTLVGSGAFSEIAEDYTNKSVDAKSAALRNAARKLGEDCFSHFCPGLANPFEDIEAKSRLLAKDRLSWLSGVMASQAALNASLQQALTPQSLQLMADGLRQFPPDWKSLWQEYSETESTRNKLILTFKQKFNDSVTHKLLNEDPDQVQEGLKIKQIRQGMDALNNTLTGAVEALGTVEDRAQHRKAQIAYAQSLKGLYESCLRGQPEMSGLGDALDPQAPRYLMAMAQLYSLTFNLWACAEVRQNQQRPKAPVFRVPAITRFVDKSDEDKIWLQWKQDANQYWNLLAASLFNEQGQFGPAGELLLKTLVPTADGWKSERGLSRFHMTSNETRTLKLALNTLHGDPVRQPRLNPKDPAATYTGIREYLQARIARINELLAAIQTWKIGKNEDDSKRMPNVVMLLEVPALAEKMVLLRTSAHTALRWQIRNHLLTLKDLDAIAAYSTPAFVEPTIPTDLKKSLLDYLDKSDDGFEHHPLLHGIKQLTLPGEAPEVHDVAEEPEKT
ncbi:MAG: hypothetical protein ACK443_04625, partial [Methylococcaceae bacterium]